jgi:hypothetical protein
MLSTRVFLGGGGANSWKKLHEQTEHDKRLALATERLPARHYKGMRIAHQTSSQFKQLGSNIVNKSKYHPPSRQPNVAKCTFNAGYRRRSSRQQRVDLQRVVEYARSRCAQGFVRCRNDAPFLMLNPQFSMQQCRLCSANSWSCSSYVRSRPSHPPPRKTGNHVSLAPKDFIHGRYLPCYLGSALCDARIRTKQNRSLCWRLDTRSNPTIHRAVCAQKPNSLVSAMPLRSSQRAVHKKTSIARPASPAVVAVPQQRCDHLRVPGARRSIQCTATAAVPPIIGRPEV